MTLRMKTLPLLMIPLLAACQTSPDTANAENSAPVFAAPVVAAPVQLIDQDEFQATESLDARQDRLARQQLVSGYLGGKVAASQSDMLKAAAAYKSSLDIAPDDPELLSRSLVYEVAAGNMDIADDISARLVAIDPAHGLAVLTRLVIDAKQGKFEGAAGRLDAFRKTGNTLVPVNAGKGPRRAYHNMLQLVDDSLYYATDAWLRQGADPAWRPEKPLAGRFATVKDTEMVERLRLPGIGGLHDWAFARLDVKDPAEAEALDAALLKLPNHNNLRVMREVMARLAADGMTGQVAARMDFWRERAPNNVVLRRLDARFVKGQYETPLLGTATGGMAAALYETSYLLTAMQLRLAAIVTVQLAAHLEPERRFGQMLLAENLDQLGQEGRAAAILQSIPAGDVDAREAHEDLAYILSRLDRTDEAIALLENMVAQDGNDLVMASVLTRFLASEERFDEAALVMDKAIATLEEPEQRHWSLFYERAKAYERSKQWAKAEPDFLKALELQPDQPYVLNYLGYSWVDQGLYLDRALGMIDKAVKARPNEGFIVDSLGWAYYKLERFEEAEKYLQRAVALSPSDALLLDHYGDALWQNGHHREARFQWERAVTFGAEGDVLAAIKDKLENGITK